MAAADTPAPAAGIGLQDAASQLIGLLDPAKDTQAPKGDAAPPEPKPEGEGVADEAPEEETPPEGEGEQPEPEGEPEGDESAGTSKEEPEEPAPKEPLHTVRVNGKDEQVTLEELLKGYSRTRDYTQKTDALATDRQILAEQQSAVSQERAQYATLLTALSDQLKTGLEREPDWDALYANDPLGWVKVKEEWREKKDKLAAAQFELQRVQELQNREQQGNLRKLVTDGRAKLVELNPSWKDPAKWDADRQRIVEYGRKVGYSDEEIAQAYDHRAVHVMNKARLYDELMAGKPKPVERKGPKVAGAGAASDGLSQSEVTKAKQRLAHTGRIEDAAALFRGLLE